MVRSSNLEPIQQQYLVTDWLYLVTQSNNILDFVSLYGIFLYNLIGLAPLVSSPLISPSKIFF
jgi:hypothetical protein